MTSAFPAALVLGRMLAALRREDVVSQREFAAEAGLGSSTLAWIESGRTTASADQLWRVAGAFVDAGILDRRGDLFDLIEDVVAEFDTRKMQMVDGRLRTGGDRAAVVLLDRIVAGVVQDWLDRENKAARRPSPAVRNRVRRRAKPRR